MHPNIERFLFFPLCSWMKKIQETSKTWTFSNIMLRVISHLISSTLEKFVADTNFHQGNTSLYLQPLNQTTQETFLLDCLQKNKIRQGKNRNESFLQQQILWHINIWQAKKYSASCFVFSHVIGIHLSISFYYYWLYSGAHY